MVRGGTYIRGFMAGLSLRPLPKRNFCFVYPFLISWFVSLGGTCFNYFCFLFFFLYGIDLFFPRFLYFSLYGGDESFPFSFFSFFMAAGDFFRSRFLFFVFCLMAGRWGVGGTQAPCSTTDSISCALLASLV